MIIPAYRAGFSVELNIGELCVRTRPYYQVALAIEIHLHGYPVANGIRNRWAFVQLGSKTLWLRRY